MYDVPWIDCAYLQHPKTHLAFEKNLLIRHNFLKVIIDCRNVWLVINNVDFDRNRVVCKILSLGFPFTKCENLYLGW